MNLYQIYMSICTVTTNGSSLIYSLKLHLKDGQGLWYHHYTCEGDILSIIHNCFRFVSRKLILFKAECTQTNFDHSLTTPAMCKR